MDGILESTDHFQVGGLLHGVGYFCNVHCASKVCGGGSVRPYCQVAAVPCYILFYNLHHFDLHTLLYMNVQLVHGAPKLTNQRPGKE